MSALDQAFIKVYKQEAGVTRTVASGQKPAVDAPRGVESQYADGTLYHDLPAEPSGQRQVPSPHAAFPQAASQSSPAGHHSPAVDRKPASQPHRAVHFDCQVIVEGPHWNGLAVDGHAEQIAAWADTAWSSPHVDANTAQPSHGQPAVASHAPPLKAASAAPNVTAASAATAAPIATAAPASIPAPTAAPALEVAWEV
ncbi:MAG: hypothetical protein J5I93_08455, partial [Pirellulaceae bacterium]|nr:hypothetical protein [Pirellulaceae bacterium]